MSPTIVGVSAHFHDSACCLLRDGKLVAAAQEERFTRLKHDPSLPKAAFRYCLAEAGLTIADIDAVAYYEDPVKKLDRQLWMGLPEIPPVRAQALFRLDALRPERELREILGFEGDIVFVDHHEAHAASAYYFSGFSEAAILTVDAVGQWATTSYARAAGPRLELLEQVSFPDSIGLLYSAVTAYLGFDVNDAEYKVMGLAPYGEPTMIDQIRSLISSSEGGSFGSRSSTSISQAAVCSRRNCASCSADRRVNRNRMSTSLRTTSLAASRWCSKRCCSPRSVTSTNGFPASTSAWRAESRSIALRSSGSSGRGRSPTCSSSPRQVMQPARSEPLRRRTCG